MSRQRVAVAPTLFAVVAVTLLVLALAFMSIPGLNTGVFVAIQRVTRVLPDPLWACITICGTGVVAFALLSPSLARRPQWYAAALPAAALAGLYSNGLKHLYGLPRPASVLALDEVHVIGHVLRANTFPSGHSVTAFTVAALLTFASTRPLRTAGWTLPLAALVALSRVAVGAHWPADLAAGAVGGWLAGTVGVVAAARWRRWNVPAGIRLLGLVAVGVGCSLFVVDLGYPQAVVLQYLAAVIAIASGALAMARPHIESRLPRDEPASESRAR